ncbi:PREDICTED: cation/H(+) antiporter 15-like [Lupinus angustifolius]|uniref:cation/H(+) antiporter 15-like n=1 Tax=Lupinus angustifolius TaxID=3871 RepID=UPI00092F4F31|nr:PREDICTED: cation/H(+) antiporter 15-like [Lupinus angustifolius]
MAYLPNIAYLLYPENGILNVQVIDNIGLIYYAFLSGLEMNIDTILHAKKKSATIAVAGIIFPLVTGPIFYQLHRKIYETFPLPIEKSSMTAIIHWTGVLTITGFPVLAHTLSELKLLYTGLGKTALSAAMISDTYGWILFTIFYPFTMNGNNALYSVLSTIIFIVVCVFLVRPIICDYIEHKTDQDEWNDHQIASVVMGVFVCSFITDFLGCHAIVGAFVYGLILPHGKFADLVTSVSDDFVNGFLTPLYFSGCGMRISFRSIFMMGNWPLVMLLVVSLILPKILSTVLATFFFGLHIQDGLALGLLLNTKGVIALVLLNSAWDKGVFSVPTYSVLTFGVLLMTVIVPPIINLIYKPRKRFEQNKLKTIQKLREDAELRILACCHNNKNATSMISIIDTFNPTRLSPMHVFGLYLIELTGRGAALVAAHIERHSGQLVGEQNLTRTQAELENITKTFEAFGEVYDAVRVETLNVVSSYATIHEDIYNTASDKHTSLILLPFHKKLTSDGVLQTTSVVYKEINQKIMQGAPCSVGIFVDREALAVAGRMACHPGVRLELVRMVLFDEAAEADTSSHAEAKGILSAVIDNEKQKELDEECVSSFRLTQVNNDDSTSYSEIEVHTAEDIPAVLNEVEKSGCDLYIVGQGNCRNSMVFTNLLEWCDCLELGVIGDILASNNFASSASMLVVQQYGYGGMVIEKQVKHIATTTSNDGFELVVV